MNNIKFISPAIIVLSGATSSGKTTWIKRFLNSDMFDRSPHKVFYCYGVFQPTFDTMKNVEFIHGLPQDFNQFYDTPQHNLLILDDLQNDVISSPEIQHLVCRESHHRNLSVIYITQNLYF